MLKKFKDRKVLSILTVLLGFIYISIGIFYLGLKWNGNVFTEDSQMLYTISFLFLLNGFSFIMNDFLKYMKSEIIKLTRLIIVIIISLVNVFLINIHMGLKTTLIEYYSILYPNNANGIYLLITSVVCISFIIYLIVDWQNIKRSEYNVREIEG